MSRQKLIRSATSRMFRLGGLAGRVGASMAGNTIANFFRDTESREEHRSVALAKNAVRVKDLLGQLKGVPMKIGQMLSLHERFLPGEVADVLRTLQQKAPSVPFEDILDMIKQELGERFDAIDHIDENAMASASIGQVHRAVLKDGREIALKVQYPGIDDVIRADLKNLKGVLMMVFSMFTRMDMELVWKEVNARLLEELDYEKEADNMRRMARLLEDDDDVVVPQVIDEVTTRHVLGMELVLGISPDQVATDHFSRDLKNAWGETIVRFVLRGLYHFRFLHADPNIANFAFMENGGIIVYDYGCMKEVPEDLCRGYIRVVSAILEHDYPNIPDILKSMGVHKADGNPVSWNIVADFADIFQEIIDPKTHYIFGDDEKVYARIYATGQKHISESMSVVFPQDIIFIDRTFGGHFGNLCRLKAQANWRSILIEYISTAFTE